MKTRSGFLTVWFLAALCTVLTLAIYRVSMRTPVLPPHPMVDQRPGSGLAEEPAADFIQLPQLAALTQMIERPLFVQERRPAAAMPETGEVKTNAKPTDLELAGVLITGEQRSVLLRQVRGGKVWRGEVGHTIEGWTITKIGREQVLLDREGESVTLKLKDQPRVSPRSSPGVTQNGKTALPIPSRPNRPVPAVRRLAPETLADETRGGRLPIIESPQRR